MKRLAIEIEPKDSKQNDFVQSLAEYFTKEFKLNGLDAKNRKSYVEVKLDKPYKIYSSVIVDCSEGKLYLRPEEGKDRYFGRLSKFVQERKADAYNCVNYNAKRIINRIKNLADDEKSITKEAEPETFFDARAIKEPIGQVPLYGVPFEDQIDYIYDMRCPECECQECECFDLDEENIFEDYGPEEECIECFECPECCTDDEWESVITELTDYLNNNDDIEFIMIFDARPETMQFAANVSAEERSNKKIRTAGKRFRRAKNKLEKLMSKDYLG